MLNQETVCGDPRSAGNAGVQRASGCMGKGISALGLGGPSPPLTPSSEPLWGPLVMHQHLWRLIQDQEGHGVNILLLNNPEPSPAFPLAPCPSLVSSLITPTHLASAPSLVSRALGTPWTPSLETPLGEGPPPAPSCLAPAEPP